MYNRYIPQPDGSYRRNRMPEAQRPQPVKPQAAPLQTKPEPCPQAETPPLKQEKIQQKTPVCKQDNSPGGFLRQLLPKDFDTGDLIVMLLLLLMAGDCEEDRNNAILTLALYFMM